MLLSFVLSSFIIPLRYSFWIFSYIFACLIMSASKIPKYLLVSFSASVFNFFMPSSVPMYRLYLLTVCIRVSRSFSFFANSLMLSMYIKWLTFSCDLLRFYPAVHFLSMWLSVIMAIMHNKGDRAAPLKIRLWIFASANLLPPTVSSTLQVFIVFSMKCMTSSDILYILRLFIIQLCEAKSYAFL